ncbi:MAG: membrane protein insertase YidC [Gemmatimonadales bacterium]|jgi:YidC/Oxa1 family membrane protein insertase
MDRRTLLAIGLMLIVAVLPTLLNPPQRPDPAAASDSLTTDLDSAVAALDSVTGPAAQPETVFVERPAPPQPGEDAEARRALPASNDGDPIVVESPLYRFTFSTRGARLRGVELREYRTFAPGDTGRAHLLPDDARFLEYALVVGNDTLGLADWSFEPSSPAVVVDTVGTPLTLTARRGAIEVTLTYTFDPDHYLFDVRGRVSGIGGSAVAVIGIGPRMRQVEADSVDNFRSYAVVTKANKTERLNFRSLDPGEVRALQGPFEWVAIKSKYFVTAVMTLEEGRSRLGGALAVGGPKPGRHSTNVDAVMSLPAPAGEFAFSVYAGPQEYKRLARIGHEFQDVNPYGWVFRPIIRPFANIIVVILIWMHENLKLEYGWVLILFGLAVRVVLWPLNQKAMKSSVAMQAIQPELKAVQERYKQDPQRMQQEVMKLYKVHGVNPLGGCWPMLIPMPVLFALFFVFRETIEFRGVSFLWLPDLSRPDPFYIIPIVMGLSMFGVSKIGQLGVPPNPQAKMMTYVMPAFLTFIFLRLSSGLNLYYAVSNIASIPQQWLIAKQRIKRLGKRE